MVREKKNIFEYAGIAKKKGNKKTKALAKEDDKWYFKCHKCGGVCETGMYVKVPISPRECSECGRTGSFTDITETVLRNKLRGVKDGE
jgi:CO dehydrogenase/acetyl-CoA synthase beta subunit